MADNSQLSLMHWVLHEEYYTKILYVGKGVVIDVLYVLCLFGVGGSMGECMYGLNYIGLYQTIRYTSLLPTLLPSF